MISYKIRKCNIVTPTIGAPTMGAPHGENFEFLVLLECSKQHFRDKTTKHFYSKKAVFEDQQPQINSY